MNRFAVGLVRCTNCISAVSTCDVDVSVPSQPSMSTLAPASFRIRSRNIQLVPSGSQKRFEKRYLHFRVHAVARWLLFWSPPAARRSNWPNRSGFAFSACTIIGFHLPSITSAVALTGHSESFIFFGCPQLQKGAYWTIAPLHVQTIISQNLDASNLETSRNGVLVKQQSFCLASYLASTCEEA